MLAPWVQSKARSVMTSKDELHLFETRVVIDIAVPPWDSQLFKRTDGRTAIFCLRRSSVKLLRATCGLSTWTSILKRSNCSRASLTPPRAVTTPHDVPNCRAGTPMKKMFKQAQTPVASHST